MLKVTSSGCFQGGFVKVLQSEFPPGASTQTSKDSPTAIRPFENSKWYSWDDIGSALWSSSVLSSPSHRSNISDLYASVIFTSSPQFPLKPAIVTRTLNDSSTAALLSSIDDDAVLIIDGNPVADIDERKAIARVNFV